MKIAIIAGELSGDALGAGLLRALSELCPKLTAEGVVGPAMRAAGCGSLAAIERLSVMGLVEVLGRLPELLRLRRKLLRHFLSDPPDVFVGIDAPDFNLGLARRLREHGIPTVQYVSPTVWAWRQGRIRGIARSVDLMLTLYPFEERFYQQQGIAVRCVGHPLADEIPDQVAQQPARAQLGLSAQARVLALLPGSRMGEVQRLAADMLAAAQWVAQRIPDLRVVIPCATDQIQRRLTTLVDQSFQQLTPQLVRGNARQVMAAADSVLVASGTATLETALVKRPMVVVYRMNRLSYMVLRRLLKVPYVAMPNLLAGECLAPEFLQEQVRAELVGAAVLRQLDPDTDHTRLLCRYRTLHQELRRNADRSAAEAVLQLATART